MNTDDANREPGQEKAGEVTGDAEVERWLDDALSVYAKAEPRAGLGGRVLARLAEARRESRHGLRWWGVLTFGAVVALVVAAVWSGRVDRKTIPQTPTAKVESPQQDGIPPVSESPRLAPNKQSRTWRTARPGHRDVQADAAPKREQFPSESPLTEQEEMLARYVRDFPERATLMARAQTDLRRQDELEMAAPWPANSGQGSDQRE